ncbi:MAG: thiamine pyrophosphate-binding protein [Immundisolibacter sp.]|uniref:thiamine pyrophosphate-binding protein n=1 Tax=Immundisolibacter sp. TaxID=1934948 RepID=UPI003EDFC163
MSQPNGAEVFLDILNGYGVEAIFSSPGSEWPPLWEALARRQAAGQPAPTYYNIRHEDLAIGEAMGYARATGKLGVCLIHATVGTLHASMGIRAAYHEQIPLLVLGGESVTFGEGPDAWVGAQWGRFLADHGGPARLVDSFTKSSFGLNTPAVLAGAVHRACALAMAAPQGPVFLSLPFEYLHQPAVLPAPTRYATPSTPQPLRAPLAQAADWLRLATNPLIIVENAARTAEQAQQLVALAERLGAGVVEGQHPGYVNFPRDHDLHAGFYAQPWLGEVDAVLMLESPGPWYPPTAMTPKTARLINVAQDPLRERDPYTGFTADLQIQGDAMAAVEVLLELIPQATGGADARRKVWAGRSTGRCAQWREDALQNATTTPIDARFLCHELNACLPDDAVIVDETILSHHTIINVMDRLKPGHFINALSGGLGLGLGMGLGAAIGLKDKLLVTFVGDGTYNYNPGLAALGFSQQYSVGMLTVIFNNGHYRSMQMGTEFLYPQGAAVTNRNHVSSPIAPNPDYGQLAVMFGGYGEKVEDPAQIRGAVERAVAAVRDGKPAILDVRIGDEIAFLAKVFGG